MRDPTGLRNDSTSTYVNQNDRMDAWLNELSDPQRRLSIRVAGKVATRDWDMGRRVLDEHMLHIVLRGGHRGYVGGRRIETHPGSMLWVPPGVAQDLHQAPGLFVKIYVRFTLENALPPSGQPYAHHRLERCWPWAEDLYRAIASGSYKTPSPAVRALLVLIFSAWKQASIPDHGLDAQLQDRILTVLDANLAARIHPRELAKMVGMSPTWFARRFARTYGCSPRSWMVRHRMRHAARMISDGQHDLGHVADQLGYADRFLFSRQFRSVLGCSPRTWRQRGGGTDR